MDASKVKPEDITFSYHWFLGTSDDHLDGRKKVMVGLVSPMKGKPYAYVFKNTGDALEFVEDMKVLINRIDQEEAESNASRD